MTQAAAALTALIELTHRVRRSASTAYDGSREGCAQAGLLLGLLIGSTNPAYAEKILVLAADDPKLVSDEENRALVAELVAAYPIPDEVAP